MTNDTHPFLVVRYDGALACMTLVYPQPPESGGRYGPYKEVRYSFGENGITESTGSYPAPGNAFDYSDDKGSHTTTRQVHVQDIVDLLQKEQITAETIFNDERIDNSLGLRKYYRIEKPGDVPDFSQLAERYHEPLKPIAIAPPVKDYASMYRKLINDNAEASVQLRTDVKNYRNELTDQEDPDVQFERARTSCITRVQEAFPEEHLTRDEAIALYRAMDRGYNRTSSLPNTMSDDAINKNVDKLLRIKTYADRAGIDSHVPNTNTKYTDDKQDYFTVGSGTLLTGSFDAKQINSVFHKVIEPKLKQHTQSDPQAKPMLVDLQEVEYSLMLAAGTAKPLDTTRAPGMQPRRSNGNAK